MTHRLLILGTLGELVSLVQKARERGIYTLVCDGYPDGPARRYADESFVIPVTEIDRIAALCKEKQIDSIITSFSDLLLECMVKIADRANISCYLTPGQLPWYRDKSATKELLADLGLPSPAFRKIPVSALHSENMKALESYISGLHFPLVTKPLDKYGSRGIYVISSLEELRIFGKKAASFSDLDYIMAEEYNTGYEFNIMTWVLDGQVHILSIADREKTWIADNEIPISSRNVYPSRLYSHVAEPARELLQRFIRHTGQMQGALSMQFFWSPEKGIQVCEIAARFFGYEHELTDIVFGLNIEDLLLDHLYDPGHLRETLANHHSGSNDRCGAVLYFQGKPGTIHDLSSARELAKRPEVVKPWIFYHEKEAVIQHGANPYVALYYIKGKNRREIDENTERFFQKMSVSDPEGNEILYKNRIPVYVD